MSITDFQNTNENVFTPNYGSDSHGIAYSCGQINPLQKTMKNNIALSFDDIRKHALAIAKISRTIIKESIEFANTRCEEVRNINIELRNAVDNGCDCRSDCSMCDEYYSEIESLKDDLETARKELEEANSTINDLKEKLNDVETL
jgi:hypothetical protein